MQSAVCRDFESLKSGILETFLKKNTTDSTAEPGLEIISIILFVILKHFFLF